MLDHPIHSGHARVGGIALLRADGAALLQHRDDKPGLPHAGLWVFPGGHCEPGESIEACAQREFFEETGYRCGALNELHTIRDLSVEGFPPVQLTVFWSRYDGVQPVHCFEGQALSFIERSEAHRHPMPDYLLHLWDMARSKAADMSEEHTKEPQYQRGLELYRDGAEVLGPMMNQVWHDDPRRLTFVLARYKFVAKMLSGKKRALEIGCADAFGTRVVQQEVPSVVAVDFDPVFVKDVQSRMHERWPFECRVHDMLDGPLEPVFDAAYSLDVLEHIEAKDERRFLANIAGSLVDDGVLIIGTPSIQSQTYASPNSKAGHVNCKDAAELKALMLSFFTNVFMFSMNDEVVHTGFAPMAHYLFAVGAGKRRASSQV